MKLDKEAYYKQFSGNSGTKVEKALERAWKNRDFEIEMYWKRATYFWAFIASSFVGYFSVLTSKNIDNEYPQAELVFICLGIVFSVAWYFVNVGSKKWQENWEHHIDMLEDEITGPIYKTVLNRKGYSVSGTNLKVSIFVIFIWICLLGRYLFFSKKITLCGSINEVDWLTIFLLIITPFFSLWFHKNWDFLKQQKKNKMKFSFSLKKVKYPKNSK